METGHSSDLRDAIAAALRLADQDGHFVSGAYLDMALASIGPGNIGRTGAIAAPTSAHLRREPPM